ncbi:MAG: hypothetical protein AB7K09_09705 [Planctomycetota bacterium]
MSHHDHEPINILNETTRFEKGNALFRVLTAAGIAACAGSFGAAMALGNGMQDFLQSWVIAVMFWLSIALGSLFFVLIQHLTHAGWSVTVRRLFEFVACALPLIGVLLLPVVILSGNLYEWVNPDDAMWHHEAGEVDQHAMAAGLSDQSGQSGQSGLHGEESTDGGASKIADAHTRHHEQHVHLVKSKSWYLWWPYFLARYIFAFVVLSLIAWWLFRKSTDQDLTGDPAITNKMEKRSAPSMFLFALCLTILAFDFLMSLDPAWYSTIFGVYYFAGCVVGSMGFMILLANFLKQNGVLAKAIHTEHYHDLGKLMFAFTIFWGYIAFSQYMLIWYGAIPEETAWYFMKASDDPTAWASGWNYLTLVLLFGHLLIPILGFMSRYVKRHGLGLIAWAVWMLCFHYLDLYWLVRPNFHPDAIPTALLPADILAWLGVGALVVGVVLKMTSDYRSCAIGDPRINESLAFENH